MILFRHSWIAGCFRQIFGGRNHAGAVIKGKAEKEKHGQNENVFFIIIVRVLMLILNVSAPPSDHLR
jgi:hypothetical protein